MTTPTLTTPTLTTPTPPPTDPALHGAVRPLSATTFAAAGWTDVCAYGDLAPEQGTCALVGGHPVAVVRTYDGDVHAVGNVDPGSGASVLARGIVGSRLDAPTLISPMYKHVFDLHTGRCLDDPVLAVPVYPVRVQNGRVQVACP